MPYKISGDINKQTEITVVNESDWSVEHNDIYEPGTYEITDLINEKNLVISRISGGESEVYGNVSGIFYAGSLGFPVAQSDILDIDGLNGNAQFGQAMDWYDDILVISSPSATGGGTVYVFKTPDDGATWIEKQAIQGPVGARFGWSVAIHGNLLAIGEPYDATNGSNTGRVRIYRTADAGESWSFVTYIYPDSPINYENFGDKLDIFESILMVGATYSYGRVYAYTTANNGTSWVQRDILTPETPASGDNFGWAIAISSLGFVVIGSQYNSKCYSWTTADDGETWIRRAKIESDEWSSTHQFGSAIATHEEIVIIGAMGINSYRGAAYGFTTSDSGQTFTQRYKFSKAVEDQVSQDRFGWNVSVFADACVIACPYDDPAGYVLNKGSLYTYSTWVEGVSWQPEDQEVVTEDPETNQWGRYCVIITPNYIATSGMGYNGHGGVAIFKP